jgi:hypothetical protein
MPSSILRSMIRLPGSITSMLNRRPGSPADGVAIRFRLISLTPAPSGTSEKAQSDGQDRPGRD